MDLETENRIAAILLKEAAEIRRQAQTEGALAYLRQPTVRNSPNSRFLTATVRGVQQANRAVEINEMWRLREKQLELDNKLRGKRHESTSSRCHDYIFGSQRSSNSITGCSGVEPDASSWHSSKSRTIDERIPREGEGLRDDEVDEFLQSRSLLPSLWFRTGADPVLHDRGPSEDSEGETCFRNILKTISVILLGNQSPHKLWVSPWSLNCLIGGNDFPHRTICINSIRCVTNRRTKRGRGAVGSRMDETGPYLPTSPDSKRILAKGSDEELGKRHVLLGPEKPISLTYAEPSDDESLQCKKKRAKKMSPCRQHSKKHKSREESKGKRKKKTRMDEKKREHRR